MDEITLRPVKDGLKWANAGPDVIACWIADMDFRTAPEIIEALQRRAHGDLGYPAWASEPQAGPLAEAFAERMLAKYGWAAEPSWVRSFTDLNQALQVILHLTTTPRDGVAMQVPAYPPFLGTLDEMGRRLHTDLADLTGCRALVLVNPHNPTGRVFTRAELTALAEQAERHDLIVISDEVHADLVYEPGRHIPFAAILPDRTITLTSATKAFNLGGIRCALAHVGPSWVREALQAQPSFLYGGANVFGVEATVAAWRHADGWLRETMTVLDRNRRLIAERFPGYVPPEATYLAWLDLGRPGMAEVLEREAKILVSDGAAFGPGGESFVRLNFATSEAILTEVLNRMDRALATDLHT
ncbi:MalY/PatB family protein [Nonomuraea africana]|uniref:cysteine-S-conjugate beta-lyase n=1 Tax=Nonomuraea africana TaxID=46171 RepID=A0ABR9K7I3_9ACTN|nr:aminotransferase class I/II-fold pyridoxal phosphate-dependent enzyme [Nonomuraea africana]MBE1557969.1 cystathionine beta-lyase [Nonomuraea africana]